MFAVRCKNCNNFPTIYNGGGCGTVFCPKCNDKKDLMDKEFFNFSKNYGNKKSAIKKWNEYNIHATPPYLANLRGSERVAKRKTFKMLSI